MTENVSAKQMSLHTGGIAATINEIGAFDIPSATESYVPVGHTQFIEIVKEQAEEKLHDYNFLDEHYGFAPKSGENMGAKMFGVLSFEHHSSPEIALSIGIRNSYDQSLAAAACVGGKVFVCDNLMFSGDIRVSRKHTGDVINDLESMISNALEIAPMRHRDLTRDAEIMKDFDLNLDEAYSIMGMAWGHGVLKPRQLLAAKQHWHKPPQEEFEDRNLWSLYNAFTEALKTSSHRDILESHTKAHGLVMKQGINLLNNEDQELLMHPNLI